MSLLQVRGLWAGYSSAPVLRDLSLDVEHGQVVAVLGPNGAGKTTLLRTLSGVLRANAGTITFEGRDLMSLKTHEIVQAGIAHCPEGRRMFPYLSTEANIRIGGFVRKDRQQVDEDVDRFLDRWQNIIGRRRSSPAGQLSGGEQQLVALGRAMLSNPKLLMLDEPSMGLAPVVVQQMYGAIRELAGRSQSIVLVEQNARHALSLADVVCVLVAGRIVHVGPASEVTADEVVGMYFEARQGVRH
jgi:branched-chain amino acid transport system ATP-binding protein